MGFNVDNLEQYKKKFSKNKKVYKFDDNIAIYSLAGQWIFTIKNMIKVRKKDWEEFKIRVAAIEKERKNEKISR